MASTFKIIQESGTESTTIGWSIIGDVTNGTVWIVTNKDRYEAIIGDGYPNTLYFEHKNAPISFNFQIYVPFSNNKKMIQFNISGIGGNGISNENNYNFDMAVLATDTSSSLTFASEITPNHGASYECVINDCTIGEHNYGNVKFIFTLYLI